MLKKLFTISLTDKAVPAILLFAVFISFGFLIPWLGFYWDDWPVLYMIHTEGILGFWDFYQYDRPFSAWTYILLAPLLGTNAVAWFGLVLLLRWLTAVMLWQVLKTIWPGRREQVFWVALLFVVCPLFPQQSVAVAYSQHWICYLFYFLSLYWMLKALESPARSYGYGALAIVFALIHLFTMEYFLGLELLRPFVLWFYFRERDSQVSFQPMLGRVIRTVWVYVPVWLVYLIWRLFFLQLPTDDVNNPKLIAAFLESPLRAAWGLLERIFQDVYYLLTVWVVAVNPLDVVLSRPFSLAVLLLMVVVFFVFGFLLKRYRSGADGASVRADWSVKAMVLGLLAVLLGMFPVWVIGRQVTLGGDRFSFAAMFGVCLALVGFLDWLSDRPHARRALIGLLLALAVHTNLYTAKAFQSSWERQRDFYWQLFWRAPQVAPGTPFISDGEIFSYVGRYSTSMGITLLYPLTDDPRQMPYWFFVYWENIFRLGDQLFTGTPLKEGLRNYAFTGQSTDAVVFRFAPEEGQCLELLAPQDVDVKEIAEPLRSLAGISNLSRISATPVVPDWAPPRSIFGTEPDHQWCYYFQKAELAAQYQEWDQVIALLREARSNGFEPGDEREYLVFIDAHLQRGDYEQAYDLTLEVKGSSARNDDNLCALWRRHENLRTQADFEAKFDQMNERLSCGF